MGRVRRNLKRLRPWRLVASLAAGAVLTTLVAWWFACEPLNGIQVPYGWSGYTDSTGYRTLPASDEGRVRYWVHDWGVGTSWLRVHNQKTGLIHEMILADILASPEKPLPRWASIGHRIGSSTIVFEQHAGWPFRCLRSVGTIGALGPNNTKIGAPATLEHSLTMPLWALDLFDPEFAELPIGVMPLRFALNTVVFAVPVYALLALPPWVIRARRRRTNRCLACGYRLEGLTAGTCPECGSVIRRAAKAG